jgi:uncharacterized membrane-anchored protein
VGKSGTSGAMAMHFHRLFLPCLLLPTLAAAQPATAGGTLPQDARKAEAAAAADAARASALPGPADVALAGQAHLHVPPGDVWVPPEPARRLLRAWGNTPGPSTLGMVLAQAPAQHWAAIVTWAAEGYVKDDQAHDLNQADILAQLRDATDQDNANRTARGFAPVEITGWLQPPAYDAAAHRLVWALQLHNAGSTGDADVNYNTRTLGRAGYLSVNLLTSASHFATDKAVADGLLRGLTFDPGHRYTDFDSHIDHVAKYGLAGLLGVVVLQKLGMFAIASAVFLKFAKIGAVAVVALAAMARRVFRKRTG